MIVQLISEIREESIVAIESFLAKRAFHATRVKTASGDYIIAIGKKEIDLREIGTLEGVKDVHQVTAPYKLVSSQWKVGQSKLVLDNGTKIGAGDFSLMMGPCSLEDENQVHRVAQFLASQGVTVMRGGAFKPRTSPYSFRGLGISGLKMMHEIVRPLGIAIISEVMESSQIDAMYPYVDVYQVGARNTQNFTLLHDLGRVDKAVLIKRGMSGTLDELLQSAEYVFASGNEKIILCERGIRTYEKAYRNTLDLNAVALLKEKSHLPVVVDPSHGIGLRELVPTMALASAAVGADGLLIEIHPEPEKAASDGDQTLNFEEAKGLISRIHKLREVL